MSDLDREIEELFGRPGDEGVSLAMVVRQGGETIAERYGPEPANLFQPEPAVIDAMTPLVSWSMAQSMVHAALGILVGDGRLDLGDPAPVPEWVGTEKAAITWLDLLEMRSGLRFVEDYGGAEHSDCIEMLYGTGKADHAAYAASQPLDHPPSSVWNYSSGSTNIVTRAIADVVVPDPSAPREPAMREFLEQRLFGPAGMPSADPRFDAAGTWVGSSFVYATAIDFAAFGELYLRDGIVGGERVLPEGWADHARTVVAHDAESGNGYGRHWWTWPDQPHSLAALGYEGQCIVVLPERDAVIVHLGKTDAVDRPRLDDRLRRVIDLL